MSKIIGRNNEKRELDRVMRSTQAELVVVYGRRRVGKTFLIRQHLNESIAFELTGLHNESLLRQLESFAIRFRLASNEPDFPVPASWLEAFESLKQWLRTQRSKRKRVLFFDEFPWLASRRSGFLSAFEEFWNTFASCDPRIVCVICGSAASWMIRKVVNSRGGLHNRATSRIRLEPFTLAETKSFLQHRDVELPDFQIAQLYMALGGIPHYLQRIEPGKSAAQNIDLLCFDKDGLLANEFGNLYQALFEQPQRHETVVRTLAKKRSGMTRGEISKSADLPSGGTLTKVLTELSESGFIREMPALHSTRKNGVYRLVDEFTLFHLSWIQTNRMTGQNVWMTKSSGQKWKAWCGYAFENLCLTHIFQIKRALGIAGVLTEEASWIYRAKSEHDEGAQIDLLIDRQDSVINVCEMKFTEGPFTIDKRYAEDLRRKLSVFRSKKRTSKAVFLTMVTAGKLNSNSHSHALVSNEVTLTDLFAPRT